MYSRWHLLTQHIFVQFLHHVHQWLSTRRLWIQYFSLVPSHWHVCTAVLQSCSLRLAIKRCSFSCFFPETSFQHIDAKYVSECCTICGKLWNVICEIFVWKQISWDWLSKTCLFLYCLFFSETLFQHIGARYVSECYMICWELRNVNDWNIFFWKLKTRSWVIKKWSVFFKLDWML